MLYSYMDEYQKKGIYPFHMPGHKRNREFFHGVSFLDWDVTEFEGTDNLHEPQGCIKELEQQFSNFYGSRQSHLLVNGSSVGLMAAIMSVCGDGDQILMARNCHKSVYHALLLADIEPIYLYPETTTWGLMGGIDPQKVAQQLKAYPKIRAVVVTSPTYEGFCSDIETIAAITKQYKIPLIVDEAHGAHFAFSSQFPQSAVKYADMVIQSLHKTLPMLGQSAILHSNVPQEQDRVLKRMLSILQTTSPSYMMMCCMDYSLQRLTGSPQYYEKYLALLQSCRASLSNSTHIQLLGKELKGQACIFDVDESKMLFFLHTTQYGTQVDGMLSKEYGLQLEFSSLYHLIALTSVCDTQEGFDRLKNAILDLDDRMQHRHNLYHVLPTQSTMVLKPKIATKMKTEAVLLSQSVHQISAEFIIPYPPGIPLVVPGEKITAAVIEQLSLLKANGVAFIGCGDPTMTRVEIIQGNQI